MSEPVPKKDRYILSSLNNALNVLDTLSVRDDLSLAEICRIVQLDKTSVFKMLYTMERRGYVYKNGDAKYRLGGKFADYGHVLSERRGVTETAEPFLRELRDRFGETVYLGILNTSARIIMTHMEAGTAPRAISTRVGYEMDAYNNPMGKVLLAYLSDSMLQSILEQLRFRVYTPKTITSVEVLNEVLNEVLSEVRTQGYAVDSDERHVGNGGVGAPVFDESGSCVASIGIVCRTEMLEERKQELINGCLSTAREISRQLGYMG